MTVGTVDKSIVYAVKSECLRSITLRYGAYYSILAYAVYKLEYQKEKCATKKIIELQNEILPLVSKGNMYEELNRIIEEVTMFVEDSVLTNSWKLYNHNIRGLFDSEEQVMTELTFDVALEHYEDIKNAVELRTDLIIEQIEEGNYGE